jgi:hypothetical protein
LDAKCDSLAWNPLGSASAHSQLAGVVASLVFAGIVLLLQRGVPAQRQTQAVSLLIAGFFTFALDSFLFGVIAGEQICARAWTETMVAAGMLGIGALGIFTSLAWLLHVHEESNPTAFRLATFAAYCLAGIVGLQLAVTAQDYLRDVLPDGHAEWVSVLVSGYPLCILALIGTHLVFHRRLRRLAERVAGPTAYITIGYVTLSVAGFGFFAGLDRNHWENGVSVELATGATVAALTLPALALITQLLALPGPMHPTKQANSALGAPDRSSTTRTRASGSTRAHGRGRRRR